MFVLKMIHWDRDYSFFCLFQNGSIHIICPTTAEDAFVDKSLPVRFPEGNALALFMCTLTIYYYDMHHINSTIGQYSELCMIYTSLTYS